jgi:uncharacterized protein YutE (UPF0331/DUF86 family)
MTQLDNIDKIVLRLDKLKEFVKELKEYQGTTRETLEKDSKTAAVVDQMSELACESVLDIARLVVTDQRLKIPEGSKGYILALGEAGILDKDFAQEFSKIAGFRNIDYAEVADKLNNRLGDFAKFSSQIARYYEIQMSTEY